MSTVAVVAACGGGGGDGSPAPQPTPVPTPAPGVAVTISGTARYESVPAYPGSAGLNYSAITAKPIRGATVQLLNGAGGVLATAVTDTAGHYSFNTTNGQSLRVRVRAELKDTDPANGMWDMTVRDNTSGDALYVLDSTLSTPVGNETRDLLAGSGWGGSSYTGTRAAAPFAVLDVTYQGLQKVLSAAPNVNLPALQLFWSKNNVPSRGSLSQGQIGTSFYTLNNGHKLYLLGAENTDTDEYDSHVVEHEFGHYLQRALSQDDSIGGEHGDNDRLDMRVAFSEGWGNGWSGIALNDPRYTDSNGRQQQSTGVLMNVNEAPSSNEAGWYSEATAQYLVWSLNADANIGFTPIYNALTALQSAPTFTSLYSFGVAMKGAGASAATVDSLWQGQSIFGTDAYGAGETNFSNISIANPVYRTHSGATQQYCISSTAGTYNKLGNSVFVRFTTSAGGHTLTLAPVSATGTDPDFYVVTSTGTRLQGRSETTDSETQTFSLPQGEHVAALTDYKLTANAPQRCFNFTVN